MMKVLLLIDSLGAGGAERQFCLLCNSLQYLGVTVKVHSFDEGIFAGMLRENNIDLTVTVRRSRYDIRPFRKIMRIISEFRPDVVHAWGWMSTYSAFASCVIMHIPLVGSARSGCISSRKFRSLLQVPLCDAIISNSVAGLKAYNVPKRKGFVVYNGFEFDRIPDIRKNESSNLVVVMVATMREEKDWYCYIDAIRLMLKRSSHLNIHFLGIGDGPTKHLVLKYGKDLIDEGYLSLPGFLAEPMSTVFKADIGVLVSAPHIGEGTSNSILEYMACSLPVVCSRSGGNTETVVDGETGILVEPGNAAELADAIEKLSVDRELAFNMGMKGRERLEKSYTVDRMVVNTIQVYSTLLN